MIMAHAPVIMPAVLRRPLPYRRALIVPAVLLHVTLVLRLGVGDARDLEWAVQTGGVGNIVAVLLFVVVAAWAALTATTTARAPADPPAVPATEPREESSVRREGGGLEEAGARNVAATITTRGAPS